MRGALPGPGKPLRRCDLQTDQAARRGLDVMGLIAYLGRRAHVWRWRVRYWWLDTPGGAQAQRSEERRVGKSVDLGGGRISKKKDVAGYRGGWSTRSWACWRRCPGGRGERGLSRERE